MTQVIETLDEETKFSILELSFSYELSVLELRPYVDKTLVFEMKTHNLKTLFTCRALAKRPWTPGQEARH